MPKRKLCPHCDQLLTLPVFKHHKSIHYSNGTWKKERAISSDEADPEAESEPHFHDCAEDHMDFCGQ